MGQVETMGAMIATARKAQGMTYRALAEALGGLSAPYVYDVEHDRRRLAPSRWAALIRALPSLSIRSLAEAALASGPVEIDASSLTQDQRKTLVDALVAQATT